jgi:hypothetical protein
MVSGYQNQADSQKGHASDMVAVEGPKLVMNSNAMMTLKRWGFIVCSFRFCKNMAKIGELVKMHVCAVHDFVVY